MFEKKNLFLKDYKNLKVLVTGSTGFKGTWLSFLLHKFGANVIGVGLKPEKNFKLFDKLKLKKKNYSVHCKH
jgi:CDP-glucose 4,6-dehydratase